MKQIHGKPVFEQGTDTPENGSSGPSSWARDFWDVQQFILIPV